MMSFIRGIMVIGALIPGLLDGLNHFSDGELSHVRSISIVQGQIGDTNWCGMTDVGSLSIVITTKECNLSNEYITAHEVCHVLTAMLGFQQDSLNHGPQWYKCMTEHKVVYR